ncbi:hypothetical protein [Yinghuangia soli]|uniref:Uncharacterized protein n=1 Tax=Yinghuangia soli TaxID=2908204 RepID=A0AA41Q9C0_9ACTN|nr:hypothetical protein [Yinghuangia soli]MCF2533980.1 hypothetical protein [Yinghuangia soli]
MEMTHVDNPTSVADEINWFLRALVSRGGASADEGPLRVRHDGGDIWSFARTLGFRGGATNVWWLEIPAPRRLRPTLPILTCGFLVAYGDRQRLYQCVGQARQQASFQEEFAVARALAAHAVRRPPTPEWPTLAGRQA